MYHRTSKKYHNKLEFAKIVNVKFIGKCKQSSDSLDHNSKKPNLFYAYCKKQGHTNDTCRRHERKSTNTPPQEKSTNHTTNATPHKRIKFVDQVCMVRIRIGATIPDPFLRIIILFNYIYIYIISVLFQLHTYSDTPYCNSCRD